MELIILITQQIAAMFFMILVGVFLVKCHLTDEKAGEYLSQIALRVVIPCMIIHAFQIEYSQEVAENFIIAFIGALLANVILIAVPYSFRKKLRLTSIEQASISYPNSGEILLPLVASILSKEMQVYCCAFVLVQIVLLFTHGVSLLQEQKKLQLKNILKNWNMWAIIIALFLFLSQITLPKSISLTIESFAGMAAPLCMLIIGMAVGKSTIKDIFGNKRSYLIVFIRLVLMPLGIILLLKISGIANYIEGLKEIFLVVFMATATSTAATVATLAQGYGKDAKIAGEINIMGVFFLTITLPGMVILYQWLI